MTTPLTLIAGRRQLSRMDAVDVLARRLAVAQAESHGQPSQQLLGEAIREVVFRYALLGEDSAPVHILTIMNQVRRELAPLWPTLARRELADWVGLERRGGAEDEDEQASVSPIRRCLDVLASVGDLQHVGSGYWLPTPTRLVMLTNAPNTSVLVIGGAPLGQLRLDGYLSVASCGNVRSLPLDIVPESLREDDTAWQDVDDWLDSPRQPIAAWAASLLHRALDELSPSHSEVGPIEIYSAETRSNEPQFFRWISSQVYQPSGEGLCFCRTTRQGDTGPRRYWLGRVASRQGTIRPISEYQLSGRDIRRLQYAFDIAANAPTRGALEYQQESVEITLTSYLPDPEFRLLLAVGEERTARPGRLPIVYRVPRDVAEPVLDRIAGLGIQWY